MYREKYDRIILKDKENFSIFHNIGKFKRNHSNTFEKTHLYGPQTISFRYLNRGMFTEISTIEKVFEYSWFVPKEKTDKFFYSRVTLSEGPSTVASGERTFFNVYNIKETYDSEGFWLEFDCAYRPKTTEWVNPSSDPYHRVTVESSFSSLLRHVKTKGYIVRTKCYRRILSPREQALFPYFWRSL